MPAVANALIAGGGPAGMTAAIALARRGVQVTIVEVQREWAPVGIGLLLQSPPLRALREIGLMDACVAAGYAHHEIDMADAEGTVRGVMPQLQVNGPGDPPAVALARATLHEILAGALEQVGAAARLGTTVTAVHDGPDAITVSLSDGSSAAYDLLVVADGLHSTTRALVFGEQLEPAATGQVTWRAAAPRPRQLTRYTMIPAGPNGPVGLVPLSDELVYLWMLQPASQAGRPPRERLADALREQLAGYGGQVPAVAASIVEPVDLRALSYLLAPAPWQRGRAVLIGDAAHTTTPHLAFGVGMAIEDAVVLAELVDGEGRADELLAGFTARRYERCRHVVESSARLGEWQLHPETPGADPVGLMGSAMGVLAQPF